MREQKRQSLQAETRQRIPLKQILQEKEFWILLLLGILYYHRPLFLGETFFFRELWTIHIPQKFLLADFIRAGEWPLWDPFMHGGLPYLANLGNTVLYPGNILYFFLSPLRAFNVNCVSHLIAASLASYGFARVLGFRPLSSFISGVIYGFCGYILSFLSLFAAFMAIPYLPLMGVFWHLFCSEGKRRWFLATVLLGSLRVLTGAPEAQIMGMLFLLGWSLLYPYPKKKYFKRILVWAFLGAFCIGLTAVQLVPMLEMMASSARGQKMDYAAFSQWSLFPGRLPELIFPEFLGDYTKLDSFSYWGRDLVDRRFPYVANLYVGALAIFLALFGGLYKGGGTSEILALRVRRALLGLALVSFILSLGRFLPFFELLYRYVPLIGFFRYPIKFMMVGILPIALLAGYASDVQFGRFCQANGDKSSSELTSRDWKPSIWLLIVLWSIFGLLALLTLCFYFSDSVAGIFQQGFFDRPESAVTRDGLKQSFIHTLLIWMLCALLYQYRRIKQSSWQHMLLAALVALDLLIACRNINPITSEDFLTEEPEVVERIRSEIGDGRLFRSDLFFETKILDNKIMSYDPVLATLQTPSNDIIWKHRWELETLRGFLGVLYKFPLIYHDGFGLANERLQYLKRFLYTLPWEERLPLLSAGGVSMILTEEELSVEGLESAGMVQVFQSTLLHLYRNPGRAKPLELAVQWKFAESDDEALRMMLHPEYDPRVHVVLQMPKDAETEEQFGSEIDNLQACEGVPEITTLKAGRYAMEYSISSPCPGYAVFTETPFPGWNIMIDGDEVAVLQANFAFSAVFLEAGEHILRRRYRPKSLSFGGLISCMSCLLLGGFCYKASWWL